MDEIHKFIDKMLTKATDEFDVNLLNNLRKYTGPPCKCCGSNLSHSQILALFALVNKFHNMFD